MDQDFHWTPRRTASAPEPELFFKSKRDVTFLKLNINLDWDWKFFAILPALNINIHSKSLEFEWLFLGVYIDKISVNGEDR
jgi:hypothetical protein